MLQPRGREICETNQLFHEGSYLAIIEMNISRFCRPDCDEGILRSTNSFSPAMCRWRIERAEGVHGHVTGSRRVLDCCSKGRGR
jgi:hypothetical protein